MTAADEIELWLVDLDGAGAMLEALERDTPRLAAQDRERAMSAADPARRRQRLAAYIALRLLLERMAGPGVRGQAFLRGPGGKPQLGAGAAVDFNLSHGGCHALIGLARGGAIGVDLESARPLRVAPHRRAAIRAAATGLDTAPLPGEEDAAFLQAWSRIEAFAKVQGRGLARTLAELQLRGRDRTPLPPDSIEAVARRLVAAESVQLSDVDLGHGLFAAAALSPGAHCPVPRQLPHDRAGLERLLA